MKVKAGSSSRCADDGSRYHEFLSHERDYFDRTAYRAVHFHGARLADSMSKAADFLFQLGKHLSRDPHPLCLSAQYSWEDEATDLAWRVTLVLSQSALGSDTQVELEP
jgi:hypothetical protein